MAQPTLGGVYGAPEPPPPTDHRLPGRWWRQAALRAIDPRLTARLRAVQRHDRLLSTAWHPGRSIAVIGAEGCSTAAALLAVAFAQHQGPRVLAIDAAGTGGLYRRLAGQPGGSIHAALVDLGVRGGARRPPLGWRRLRPRLQAGRDLLLLATDPSQTVTPMTADEYRGAVAALRPHVPIMVTDAPPVSANALVEAVVSAADQVVIVGPDDERGHDWIQRCLPWVSAINPGRTVTGLLMPHAGTSLATSGVPIFTVPHDRSLANVLSPVLWDDLGDRTRDAATALAAHLAAAFAPT